MYLKMPLIKLVDFMNLDLNLRLEPSRTHSKHDHLGRQLELGLSFRLLPRVLMRV